MRKQEFLREVEELIKIAAGTHGNLPPDEAEANRRVLMALERSLLRLLNHIPATEIRKVTERYWLY